MGDHADDRREREDQARLDRVLGTAAAGQRVRLEDMIPLNPWDSMPTVDPAAEERAWIDSRTSPDWQDDDPDSQVPWNQRDVPPELRALGVERDTVGSILQVVQVSLPGAPRTYTYQWWNITMVEDGEHDWRTRGDWLAKGDWVRLPGNVVTPEGSKGIVAGFGRSGYNGPLKDVAARIGPQDPWTVQMEAVRTRGDALKVWRAAKARGLPQDRLDALTAVGSAALEKAGRS